MAAGRHLSVVSSVALRNALFHNVFARYHNTVPQNGARLVPKAASSSPNAP